MVDAPYPLHWTPCIGLGPPAHWLHITFFYNVKSPMKGGHSTPTVFKKMCWFIRSWWVTGLNLKTREGSDDQQAVLTSKGVEHQPVDAPLYYYCII